MDFFKVRERVTKQGTIEIYPDFEVKKSRDIMIRGGKFYAIWDASSGVWSTDEYDVARIVDQELWDHREKVGLEAGVNVKAMQEYSSGSWAKYKQFVSDMGDNYHALNGKLIFANDNVRKTDYGSKRLPYPLEEGSIDAYDEMISTLYASDERKKIEWAIGAIVAGDAKDIQKFIVLFGDPGTGKGTVIDIITKLFPGYYTTFDAQALTTSSNAFSTEAFRDNPLVAVQNDGDLSRINDNTKLNTIVSHEEIVINEKYKSSYTARVNCFLFVATNKPVKITDGKSGIIRRLIDVRPTGRKIPPDKFVILKDRLDYELGAIAYHCLQVYKKLGKNYYADYRPTDMMMRTDVFYNFVDTYYDDFRKEDGTTLKAAYEKYQQYCNATFVDFKLPQYKFREELKNYFRNFEDRVRIDGKQVRSYYSGFITSKFGLINEDATNEEEKHPGWLIFDQTKSLFDELFADCPAQYANDQEKPTYKWTNVKTKLRDLDTTKTHYVKTDPIYIQIDFDLKDENGNKSYVKNVEAANKWPPTYAELSKSGSGVHLCYEYTGGDPTKLSRVYSEDIEVKVFSGNSSLRRRLTRCNNMPIAKISSGLPLKEEKQMINFEAVKSEKKMRELILRNMNKEIHPGTKPSMDFIYKIVEDAYASGLHYDISDMKSSILAFANNSTHHAEYCVGLCSKMHYKSDEPSEDPIMYKIDIQNNTVETFKDRIVFYDVEVFPNLFLVNWKFAGPDQKVVRMINPSSVEIESLLLYKLVGFNCRRYDNHMLYARLIGYTNKQLYILSQKIISDHSNNAMFGEAYNISYTDVYDFCSKKQSLKKWEIELGIHHQELGLKWDEPVPEELWPKVAEYCDNDVLATEAVFEARKEDWVARQVLADIAGMSVNDTTNSLTTRIIFGKNRKPQSAFNYRFMGDESQIDHGGGDVYGIDCAYTVFDKLNRPIFPGYEFKAGKSFYRGEEVGEGGYVYAEPGIYGNVALLDISSMHPSSIVAEQLFGPEYTAIFKEILDARIAIKHKEFDRAKVMLNGALAKYLDDESAADDLAQALKIAINSVYGLTSAKFDNPFHDYRNVDNIVAKRGALFMINLKHEVQSRGYTVAHIKTDSIKIPNATPEIIQFVMDYGKLYGYNFEHEATYDRMCLVNDAVYICKVRSGKHAGQWSATGAQFQHPYVFKYLFSKEPITFEDMCETKATSKGSLYLDMNEKLPNVEDYEKELAKLNRDINKQMMATYDPQLLPKLTEEDYKNVTPVLWQQKQELEDKIQKCHNYVFVGRVGQFCPVKDKADGGLLMREQDGKYYAAAGTKGYRWKEAEVIRSLGLEDQIDKKYFQNLVDEAISAVSKYGDFEWFTSESPFIDIQSDELPF